MNNPWTVGVLCAVIAIGCADTKQQDELQKRLGLTQSERDSLQKDLAERDAYVNQVLQAVNEVYADLEKARSAEALLKKGAGVTEGTTHLTSSEARQNLLQRIGDIGSALKENRKKIAQLQSRLKADYDRIAGLSTLVENLKTSLQERELSIAGLEAQVRGLESTLRDKNVLLSEKESLIETQKKEMGTGFYVVGTRDDLEKKGIITEEGGFLWGLLGSTTIMGSGIEGSDFLPIDKTSSQKIAVAGKIDEILPRRKPDFYATAEVEKGGSELTIVTPEKFWQDRYLVIVVD